MVCGGRTAGKTPARWPSPPAELVAPELVLAEIASALWKYVRVGQLAEDIAKAMLSRAPSAFARLVPLEELLASAFALSLSIPPSCVYDLLLISRWHGARLRRW